MYIHIHSHTYTHICICHIFIHSYVIGLLGCFHDLAIVKSAVMNWVIWRYVDEPRVCHTEWSQSERGKQTSSINASMWNLKKWSRWAYFQGRNRDSFAENRLVDKSKEKKGETNQEIGMNTYKLSCVKWIASGTCSKAQESQLAGSVVSRRVGWRREAQEEGDICIHRADSHCCTAQASIILWSNYTPVKN